MAAAMVLLWASLMLPLCLDQLWKAIGKAWGVLGTPIIKVGKFFLTPVVQFLFWGRGYCWSSI